MLMTAKYNIINPRYRDYIQDGKRDDNIGTIVVMIIVYQYSSVPLI